MHINLEQADTHAIQAYGAHQLKINSIVYNTSLIVSREEIITNVKIHHIGEMNEEYLQQLIKYQPEVILIGHTRSGTFPSASVMIELSKQRIGIECMDIGAASRTFNVLLSESRKVVAGFIFP